MTTPSGTMTARTSLGAPSHLLQPDRDDELAGVALDRLEHGAAELLLLAARPSCRPLSLGLTLILSQSFTHWVASSVGSAGALPREPCAAGAACRGRCRGRRRSRPHAGARARGRRTRRSGAVTPTTCPHGEAVAAPARGRETAYVMEYTTSLPRAGPASSAP